MNRLLLPYKTDQGNPLLRWVSPVVALLLLTLWAGTTGHIAMFDICTYTKWCTVPEWLALTPGVTFINATVGGLVSALVISQLAVTRPGENPVTLFARKRSFLPSKASALSKETEEQVNLIAAIYLVVWLAVGLLALIVGLVIIPEANTALKDAGATWLGIAVAAAYAYFGIDPVRS